ncbi:MAG: glycosyltransferase family 39 protein [Chloroflexi bacterium]|nr:glycosyltransferase family 39 protein [Chloroflexota bacterium]
MQSPRTFRTIVFSDLGILILLALGCVIFHTLTNGQYGFHRDELALIEDARYLDWGYVAYPPVTPFITRVGLELFGASLVGLRLIVALGQGVVMVLVGLMARDLGGKRLAQVLAALAIAISPVALFGGVMLSYFALDYVWWIVVAFCVLRLLKTDDARWWLAIGAFIGIGMMTKYTMAVFVIGLVVGVLLSPARNYLRTRWLWLGAAIALVIFLPNLIWQIQHNFISIEFLGSIHERDIAWGRTDGYLVEQLYQSANPFTLPLWIAGLYFYFFAREGKRFRPLGWMYVVPFVLLLVTRGRGYYVAPAYAMLIAAGALLAERWLDAMRPMRARVVRAVGGVALALGAAIGIVLMVPVAPINSPVWQLADDVSGLYREMVGWEDLVEIVAGIYNNLPANERARAGIHAGNYGEVGSINLYGARYGLPKAISNGNSSWLRGYGNPPPETVVVVGARREDALRFFVACEEAGRITNRYNVRNEETTYAPVILICRGVQMSWDEMWKRVRVFQ